MYKFLIPILSLFYIACTPSKSENEPTEKVAFLEQENYVDTMIVQNTTFLKEMVSNGKLKALRKSELKFNVGEKLVQLNVKNGQKVGGGETIAVLEQYTYRQRMNETNTALKKARLDLQNLLIGQGYDLETDSANIPKALFETTALRSGYLSALGQEEDARYAYQGTVLKAPFAGKIANLKYKVFEQVNPGEVFCVLIDDSEFEVEFSLVESEIRDIEVGGTVTIIPFSLDKEFRGKVSEINPLIDENGLITVKARVKNTGELMEGMNVKVLSQREVPNQLVVPKSAVILRQNQEVLFKYVDGVAFWTYVQTGLENSTSYTVIAHPEKGGTLAAGDTVIISDNLNLAHESAVKIK